MNYIIRKLRQVEVKVLDTFLYEAIYIPEGLDAPPMEIINRPELTELMKQMLTELKICKYKKTSLAVQKQNYAVKMYKNVGFEIVDENEEEYIMVCQL